MSDVSSRPIDVICDHETNNNSFATSFTVKRQQFGIEKIRIIVVTIKMNAYNCGHDSDVCALRISESGEIHDSIVQYGEVSAAAAGAIDR